MRSTIRLGKIAGVDIGIHYSWFVVLVLVTWTLAELWFPYEYPGWTGPTYWATGLVASLLLFVSVLVHELAHSVVAKARGLRVEGITLFILGGVANLKGEARDARDEFAISAVGPLASVLLSGLFWLVHQVIPGENTPVAAVVVWLSSVNIWVAIFNMLPGFPLDGGRVLLAVVWGVTGSRSRATRVATLGGQIVGLLLITLGVTMALVGVPPVFARNPVSGVWIGVIGWFLHNVASRSRADLAVQTGMQGILVRDVMRREPDTVTPDATVYGAVFEYFLHREGLGTLPVCEGDRLVGILTLSDVKKVPRERWEATTVREAMTPMPLKSVRPDDELSRVLELLGEHSINQAPVVESGQLVGLLTRADIIRLLHSHRELGVEPQRARAGNTRPL